MLTGRLALSKHGVAACLPARAAVIAAADPTGGQFLAAKTLQENVKLAPSLLSCFDLVFALQDDQATLAAPGANAAELSVLTPALAWPSLRHSIEWGT